MLMDYNYDIPHLQFVEHRTSIVKYFLTNENNSKDTPESSDAHTAAPESAAEAIVDAINNPGISLGGC